MRVLSLIAGRVASAFLTLLLVSVLVFAAIEAIPGDAATRFLGRDATPESVALFRDRLHLNDQPVTRYLAWLGGTLTGQLGQSLVSQRQVAEILAPRLGSTLVLAAAAFLLYWPLAVVPAVLAALYRNGPLDHLISVINLIALSLPIFLVATILLVLFVVVFPVFPAVSNLEDARGLLALARNLTLPALSLAIVMAAYALRVLRDNLIEVLDSEYVRMAELLGQTRLQVLLRHALPNALIPTLNVTALNIAFLVSGVVIVEKVYAYPGFGSLLVDAMLLDDTPVVLAGVIIAAAVYVAANLMADLGALLLNPRLRHP